MLGAIIGDIVGSRFEFKNIKTKDFELFTDKCRFTDDTVMSLAVARALLDCKGNFKKLGEYAVKQMRAIGRDYPRCGYGKMFAKWLFSEESEAYNSYGNGSAMRVSACRFAAKTHNHPEGLKGAEAVAAAVFIAREGCALSDMRNQINEKYYTLDFTLDDIRGSYRFNSTCQGSVPQALTAFLESDGFEDAIRNAVSIGGDSDTIAAIAGGIAEAYYGIPSELRSRALSFLDERLIKIVEDFEKSYPPKVLAL